MTYGINTNSKTPLPFFQCSRRSKGRCDTSSYISEKNAVASVIAALEDIMEKDTIEYEKVPIKPQDTESLTLLQAEIDKISLQEKRIKDAYISGIDTMDEYRENKKMLSERKEYLESKLRQQSQTEPCAAENNDSVIRQSISNLLRMIEADSSNYEEISAALSEHIYRIEYLKSKNHMKLYLC